MTSSLALPVAVNLARVEVASPDVLKSDFPEPSSLYATYNCRARCWKAVAALVTITGLVAIVYLFLTSTLLTFSLSLAALLLLPSIDTRLTAWSKNNEKMVEMLRLATEKLGTFAHFSDGEIRTLLQSHEIDPARVPFQDLSARPFKILLAHYLAQKEICHREGQQIQAETIVLDNVLTAINSTTLVETFSDFVIEKCLKHFSKLQDEYVPKKIKAVCLLQRIYAPLRSVEEETIARYTPKSINVRDYRTLGPSRAHRFGISAFALQDGTGVTVNQFLNLPLLQLHQRLFLRG